MEIHGRQTQEEELGQLRTTISGMRFVGAAGCIIVIGTRRTSNTAPPQRALPQRCPLQ